MGASRGIKPPTIVFSSFLLLGPAAPGEEEEGEVGRDFVGTPENIRRGRREGGGRELAPAITETAQPAALGHRSCFRSGFSPWQALPWSIPGREEDRTIVFEVALYVLIASLLCRTEASHHFLVLHRVVPPASSWDGEPVLVAALVSHDGVPEFH